MKYSVLGGFVLSAVALLSGCLGPSVPEAKDIEAGLIDVWSSCKMLRPVSIKKTNGLDQGRVYQMAIEYKLEFVGDIANEDIWGEELPEVDPRNYNIHNNDSLQEYNAATEPLRRALIRKEEFWKANCPEPISKYFWSASTTPGFAKIYKKDIKAGDGFIIDAVFDMVKSEKGWIVQQ